MRKRHDWVAVVGLSMGGGLAVALAAEREDVPVLVLLSPYVAMPAAVQRLAATSAYWGWMVPYFTSLGGRSIRDPEAAERALGHGLLTPGALRALHEVTTRAARSLPLVKAPTLVIQSREDNRILRQDAEAAYARLGSAEKEIAWIDGAGHVITVDFGCQRVFELTADWLAKYRPASTSS